MLPPKVPLSLLSLSLSAAYLSQPHPWVSFPCSSWALNEHKESLEFSPAVFLLILGRKGKQSPFLSAQLSFPMQSQPPAPTRQAEEEDLAPQDSASRCLTRGCFASFPFPSREAHVAFHGADG